MRRHHTHSLDRIVRMAREGELGFDDAADLTRATLRHLLYHHDWGATTVDWHDAHFSLLSKLDHELTRQEAPRR